MTIQRTESPAIQGTTNARKLLILAILLVGIGILAGYAAAYKIGLLAIGLVSIVILVVLLIWPDAATPLVSFLLYSNIVVLGVRFHGLPAIASILVPLLLLLPIFYHLVIRGEKLILPRALPWLLLFMIVLMVSTILSNNFRLAFANLVTYFTEGLILFVLITNAVRSSQHMRYVIWGLLAAGILMGTVPLYQQVTEDFNNNYGGLAQISDASFRTGEETLQGDVRQPRLAGAVGEINRFAQVMLILVPLGIFRFWGETSRILRILALLATFSAGIGMVLGFSRGAAVAFGLMVILMVFFRVIKPAQLLAFVVVAGMLLMALPQYSARLLSIQSITGFFNDDVVTEESAPDGAIKGRATVMLAAALVYADYPIVGVGPGMFKYYARDYSQDLGLRTLLTDREAHSLYLGMAAETGTLGLIFFFGMIAITIRDLFRVRKRSRGVRPDLENLATSFILVLLAYLTTGLFLHLSYMRYFWLIFALASAASTIALRELDQSSTEPAGTSFPYGRVI